MDHVGEDDELLNKVASVTLGAAQLSRTTQNESMAFEGRYAEKGWTVTEVNLGYRIACP